jgi:hypothetical protein
MNKFFAMDGNTKFERVSKRAARVAYELGKPVVLCPCKLYPFGGYRPSMMLQRDFEDDAQRDALGLTGHTFVERVQNFEWYNANCWETGYYASFFIEVK